MNNLFEFCTIDNFCSHVMFEYKKFHFFKNEKFNLDAYFLANEFRKYFKLQYPLSLQQILTICNDSNFSVHILSGKNKSRGYNFTYGNTVAIFFKEKDSPSGQIFTILHELYEIIYRNIDLQNPNFFYKDIKKDIESKANFFSACVYIPYENALDWMDSNGLDVFGLKNFFNCSYVTAVIQMNKVLCNMINAYTLVPTPVISIFYERPYWKGDKKGKIPRLQLKFYGKSQGFPFAIKRSEIKEILFSSKELGDITVHKLINAFSKSDNELLLHNLKMVFRGSELRVDILIRKVNWRKYKYVAKVLFQIIPSFHKDLLKLANRLGIKQYNIDIHAFTDEEFTETDYRLLSELDHEHWRWQLSYLLDIDIP